MSKKKNAKRIPEKLKLWIEARKRFHLSRVHVQMARELGMNPAKFGKIANHTQERWKAPLPIFIEELYFKRFGRERPERVVSIEQIAREIEKKKAEKKKRKELRRLEQAQAQEADSCGMTPAGEQDSTQEQLNF
ncbi:MAG: hypothetical protein AB1486_34670 [Planctomycetota bacterium]